MSTDWEMPPFHRKGIPHRIELEGTTNLSLPMMLMAGAMGMPFIPVKTCWALIS